MFSRPVLVFGLVLLCEREPCDATTAQAHHMTLAVIYSRISHDPEGRQAGVERQEQDCRQLAAVRGWLVLEPVYRESDVSASTRSKKRWPVFEQMLSDLGDRCAGVLLAYSTSRLTRRPLEYERLIELTSRTGLEIHTVASGPVRLDTADGRALARVLAVIDAAEAERTSERVNRAKLQRAEQGLWHGGPFTPFGYCYAADPPGRGLQLRIDPVRARLVREARSRVVAGDSLGGICKDWNARGLVASTGVAWRPQGIRKMLVLPSTAGMTERQGKLHPGAWPAILTRQQWDAARAVLLDPSRDSRTFRQVAKRYPLAGLLFCGLCGHRLVSNPLRGLPSFNCSPRLLAAARRSASRPTTWSGTCSSGYSSETRQRWSQPRRHESAPRFASCRTTTTTGLSTGRTTCGRASAFAASSSSPRPVHPRHRNRSRTETRGRSSRGRWNASSCCRTRPDGSSGGSNRLSSALGVVGDRGGGLRCVEPVLCQHDSAHQRA